MITSLQGPLKYLQGAGMLRQFGTHCAAIGKKVLILITPGGEKRFGNVLRESLDSAACAYQFCIFNGDTNIPEIARVSDMINSFGCDLVAGIGGGRVLDTARAAADLSDKRLIIVPTTASSDAPCSAVAVIHDENGKTIEIRSVKRNPDLVLVDTEIIAQAPAYYLSAGIGDALATYFEAHANCLRQKRENNGEYSTRTALAMSRLCYEIILEFGVEAIWAVENNIVNYALEQLVQAVVFLSGYGFENGGVAAAHAINEGFSIIPRCSKILHGDLVGFGILVQLELEKRPEDEKEALRKFMTTVGLPTCLKDLGLESMSDDELRIVSEAACSAPPMKNMPFPVCSTDVYDAILAANNG